MGDVPSPRPRVIVAITGALVAARVAAVIGFPLFRYVDSIEYDRLDFSGRWRRPWTTPLLYRLAPGGSDAAVVLLQALVGGLAWSLLVVAVVERIRSDRVRIAAGLAVGGLAVTTSVTNWDTAKLSESLAVSLSVALLAAWIRLLHRPTQRRVAVVLALSLPWLFVRQSLLPIGWALTLLACVLAVAAVRRRRDLAPRIVLAVGLVVLTVLASVSFSRNQEIARTNLTAIVSNRISHDPDHLDWFRSHGMPLPPGDATDFGSLEADPNFTRWVRDEATGTYARFLATHPWHAVTAPMRDLFEERATFLREPPFAEEIRHETEAMLSPRDAYGGTRPLLPRPIESLLLDPGRTGGITLLLAGAILLGILDSIRIGRMRAAVRVGFVVLILSALGFWAAWHGSTTELPRLGTVPAVIARIGVILLLAAPVDAHLGDRRRVSGTRGDDVDGSTAPGTAPENETPDGGARNVDETPEPITDADDAEQHGARGVDGPGIGS